MRKTHLCLIVLFSASMLNYYTDFGFLLNSDILIGLWLLFYAIILPIGLMYYYKIKKIRIYVFLLYLLSLFVSGFDFFDFGNFEIRGDGATQYVVKIIFTICIISSFTSFLFFLNKNPAPQSVLIKTNVMRKVS